jgi:hypothetical protein
MILLLGEPKARIFIYGVGLLEHDGLRSVFPFFGDEEKVASLISDLQGLGFECQVVRHC